MTTNKTPKDLMLVNCHEIPETICVETLFINQSTISQTNYDKVCYLTSSTGSIESNRPEGLVTSAKSIRPVTKPPPPPYSFHVKPTPSPVATVQQCQLPPQVTSHGTMGALATALTSLNNNASPMQTLDMNTPILNATTLGSTNSLNIPNVKRSFNDKVQQSDVSAFNKKSVAVQCKLDDELEDLGVEWPVIDQESLGSHKNLETEKEIFLKFIEQNSAQHKNFKECLICGELCKSSKYFYGHMSIHRGPKALCYKCGQYLDHKKLFLNHKCRRARQLEKAFLQCPHYNCSVKAISPLELFDHINEHANNRMYKCSPCHQGFCTGQEFLRHLIIRAKCYTNARKKRFSFYGLESQRDRSCRVRVFTLHTFKKCTTLVKTFLSKRVPKRGVCKICLKTFANKSVYTRHRLKCIAKFRKRLTRKEIE